MGSWCAVALLAGRRGRHTGPGAALTVWLVAAGRLLMADLDRLKTVRISGVRHY